MSNQITTITDNAGNVFPVRILDLGDGTYSMGVVGKASTNVSPVGYSTVSNVFADVPGSLIDTAFYESISYTIINTGVNSINWQVLGSNDPLFTVSVVVKASATVAANANDNYSSSVAVWRYYKVQAEDTVNLSHGIATVVGYAKG